MEAESPREPGCTRMQLKHQPQLKISRNWYRPSFTRIKLSPCRLESSEYLKDLVRRDGQEIVVDVKTISSDHRRKLRSLKMDDAIPEVHSRKAKPGSRSFKKCRGSRHYGGGLKRKSGLSKNILTFVSRAWAIGTP